MQPGQTVLLNGLQPARVHAVRAAADVLRTTSRLMPDLAVHVREAIDEGAIRAAIVSLLDKDPAADERAAIIVETVSGWETLAGEPLTLSPLTPAA